PRHLSELTIGWSIGREYFAKPSLSSFESFENLPVICGWRRSWRSALAGAMTALNDIHVLMVDDNGPMRQLIRALARAGGIVNFSEAETAASALEILRATPIDLVIVDW